MSKKTVHHQRTSISTSRAEQLSAYPDLSVCQVLFYFGVWLRVMCAERWGTGRQEASDQVQTERLRWGTAALSAPSRCGVNVRITVLLCKGYRCLAPRWHELSGARTTRWQRRSTGSLLSPSHVCVVRSFNGEVKETRVIVKTPTPIAFFFPVLVATCSEAGTNH